MPQKTVPFEMLTTILSFLSRIDLRNARQVSKSWADAAACFLLKDVHLRLNRKTHLHLLSIPRHAVLNKHVRRVYYDSQLIKNETTQSFDNSITNTALSGVHIELQARQSILPKLTRRELTKCYTNCCKHIKSQPFVARSSQGTPCTHYKKSAQTCLDWRSCNMTTHQQSTSPQTPGRCRDLLAGCPNNTSRSCPLA